MRITIRHEWRAAMSMGKVKKAVKALNTPTEGPLAWLIWRVLSSNTYFKGPEASRLYAELGYIPFSGYPLKRA